MINIVKGTKDILPGESYKWQFVEDKFMKQAASYGFKEIRTPLIEHTELFKRGIGDTTDVVNKEMYTFEIADRSLSLKPEGTASVVRSFIESKLYADIVPAKYYYITSCYRYEKMQKGRQREFHQFGIEVFGSNKMSADAEIIAFADQFLRSLGINDLQLRINSIGCPTCRAEYRKALQDFFRPNLEELCDTCKERFEKNPMRILDCKNPRCKELGEGAPNILDYLCDDCRNDFDELQKDLDALGIEYIVDPGIVRGLDYYTKTAFEFVTDRLGAQGTVCGGGRYDNLVSLLGGPDTPGVGFGLGIERLLLLMEEEGIEIPEPKTCNLFIAAMGENAKFKALSIAKELRNQGFDVIIDVCERGLKAQLKYADRLGAKYCAVIGDNELEKGVAALRNMQSSTQEDVPIDKLTEYLK